MITSYNLLIAISGIILCYELILIHDIPWSNAFVNNPRLHIFLLVVSVFIVSFGIFDYIYGVW